MAEHAHTTCRGQLPPADTINLDAHPDVALLRRYAALGRLHALTEELERIAAALPARTTFGRKMKGMVL